MDFEYSDSEVAFREEVRNFLRENLPPKAERDRNFLSTWLAEVRARGWVGFSWPKQFGGSDGGLIEQTILKNGAVWDANMILDDGGDLTAMAHENTSL